MKLTYVRCDQITDIIRSFVFKKPPNFNYVAGQYIALELPHSNPDYNGTKRWFTLSSSPTEDELRITTKIVPKHSSFKETLIHLKPGDEVDADPTGGDFTLPNDPTKKLVFIAGGIGITPFRSMIKYLNDTGEKRDITLIYGLRSESDAVFTDLITEYGANLIKLVDQPMTAETILKNITEPTTKLIYISGPEPMVKALGDSLKQAGIPKSILKGDYFPYYTEI